MFTGIVAGLASIAAAAPVQSGCRLEIDLGPLAGEAHLGDSICVSGACLTVAALTGTRASFDVSAETARKTTIGSWRANTPVNLELALRFGDRLGGHLVSGHVDGVGKLLERRRDGEAERFTFLLPDAVKAVEKGSLAIDGVSLTTWDCRGRQVSVAVIPHTLAMTTLGAMRPGAQVNMEQDQIGRWLESLLPGHRHPAAGQS